LLFVCFLLADLLILHHHRRRRRLTSSPLFAFSLFHSRLEDTFQFKMKYSFHARNSIAREVAC